jgi:hypothetical protein
MCPENKSQDSCTEDTSIITLLSVNPRTLLEHERFQASIRYRDYCEGPPMMGTSLSIADHESDW